MKETALYYGAAVALKAASATPLTRRAYRGLARLKSGPRIVALDQAQWLLDNLPSGRLLDLGTGWVHAYSLHLALLRNDCLHCFDIADNRHFKSFQATVPVVLDHIRCLPLDPAIARRAEARAAALIAAKNWDEAYQVARINYQVCPNGLPHYPENHFDAIYSIDVLEHVDAELFPVAVQTWHHILKPGGMFLAQVGVDDHLAFYSRTWGSKRYLRHSRRTWDRLLGNDLVYINRLTASEIITVLKDVGFVIDEITTDDRGDTTPQQVHPDYCWQSEADIRAVRLIVRAHKR